MEINTAKIIVDFCTSSLNKVSKDPSLEASPKRLVFFTTIGIITGSIYDYEHNIKLEDQNSDFYLNLFRNVLDQTDDFIKANDAKKFEPINTATPNALIIINAEIFPYSALTSNPDSTSAPLAVPVFLLLPDQLVGVSAEDIVSFPFRS